MNRAGPDEGTDRPRSLCGVQLTTATTLKPKHDTSLYLTTVHRHRAISWTAPGDPGFLGTAVIAMPFPDPPFQKRT